MYATGCVRGFASLRIYRYAEGYLYCETVEKYRYDVCGNWLGERGGREAEKTTGLLEELGHFCRSYLGMVLLCKRATIFLLIYHSQSISKNCF